MAVIVILLHTNNVNYNLRLSSFIRLTMGVQISVVVETEQEQQ